MTSSVRSVQILIVGAGFSGIGMAIRLKQRGIDDFVLLERAGALGGTWRDNDYPGCACDVQSSLYSFSFAPNPDWSRRFSPQQEVRDYLTRCAETHGVAPHIALGETLTSADWDEQGQWWRVESTTGTWQAAVLVMASGPLSDPALPRIPGLETFAGRLFHSAQWDHDFPLDNARVAVIGTGASAIQFVPQIQPRVGALHLFQRTPPWVLPRRDRAVPEWRRALRRHVPFVQLAERASLHALREAMFLPFRHPRLAEVVKFAARRHMHGQVRDPALREALTPSYTVGCKRLLISDDYYPALTQPNVEVVTTAIQRVTPRGVLTSDARERAVDAIILGTGFRATDPAFAPFVRGRDGRTLAEVWKGSPKAYMGTTVAGFPNLFLLLGPNTGLGHSSVLLMVEAQLSHILRVIDLMTSRGAAAAEPTAQAQARYVAWIDRELQPTVWQTGGCSSWYLDSTGRNAAIWPFGVGRFRRTVSRVRPADYSLTPRRSAERS